MPPNHNKVHNILLQKTTKNKTIETVKIFCDRVMSYADLPTGNIESRGQKS